jgi:hypothetical protein
MDTIERLHPAATGTPAGAKGRSGEAAAGARVAAAEPERHVVLRWLQHDIPYIAMLLLGLAGIIFRLPVVYWVVLIPVFGVISVAEGWRHFAGRDERLVLLYSVALSWSALLLAIYLLSNGGVQGVMNVNASSLAMLTLLALGTFVAGVQARVWQICGVGAVLFLAVPGLGWLDQSPLLLTAATCAIVALGGLGWWVSQLGDKGRRGATPAATPH